MKDSSMMENRTENAYTRAYEFYLRVLTFMPDPITGREYPKRKIVEGRRLRRDWIDQLEENVEVAEDLCGLLALLDLIEKYSGVDLGDRVELAPLSNTQLLGVLRQKAV